MLFHPSWWLSRWCEYRMQRHPNHLDSIHLVQSGNIVLSTFVQHNGNQICHESEDHGEVCAPFNGRPGKGL